jgi:hypothetical protein
MVSTRHVEAARNHSLLDRRIKDVAKATFCDRRLLKKAKKAALKTIIATAEGSLDVASVTSPPGRDAIAINQ